MQADGLAELVADREDRVEARHGVLEDDRAAFAPEVAHLLFRPCREVLALVEDVAAFDTAVVGQDLHDGVRGDGFAGAGLADNAENFAGVQVKRHAVDGLYLAGVGAERCVQVLHAQKILFTHTAHLFSFGSNASRRPSPSKFRLRTIRQIIRAGKISLYGYV